VIFAVNFTKRPFHEKRSRSKVARVDSTVLPVFHPRRALATEIVAVVKKHF
jgi:hypothetical protein